MGSNLTLELLILPYLLALFRVAAFLHAFPFLGGQQTPRLVRIAWALMLTWCLCGASCFPDPVAMSLQWAGQPWGMIPLALLREAIYGALLGYAFALFLLPARVAGEYVSQELGLTLGQISDPGLGHISTGIGALFDTLMIVAFFGANLHHLFLQALQASFISLPLGNSIPATDTWELAQGLSQAHHWGLWLVLPIAVCLALISLFVALMMRAAPALNLFTIGIPLRIVAGLVAMWVFMPQVTQQMDRVLNQSWTFVRHLIN